MTLFAAVALVLALAAAAFLIGFRRASAMRSDGRLHSLPVYHALYAALWCVLPALLFLALWAPTQTFLVNQAVLSSPAGKALPDFDMERDAIISEAREIAAGQREAGFNAQSSELAPLFRSAENRYTLLGGGIALVLAAVGATLALRRSRREFRA